ncbi:hypothetical protein LCGC14_2978030, partial [marine sediment metagenome]
VRSFNDLVSINSSIEVVCVEKNRLGYEMNDDYRIQTDSPHFIIRLYNSKPGAKVPRWLLKEGYKNLNVCFCVYQKLSDIFNIFHEVSHFFNQPFENEIDDLIKLNEFEYLQYQIRRLLNEYCANYNMFKFFFDNHKSWVSDLESQSIGYLFGIRSFDKNQVAEISARKIMFCFFEYEFKLLFYCFGIWRGFSDFRIQPQIVPFDIHLKDLYRRMDFDENHILFIDSLKQELLKLGGKEEIDELESRKLKELKKSEGPGFANAKRQLKKLSRFSPGVLRKKHPGFFARMDASARKAFG